ncbi:actinidain-like isoform X1 [Hordeum vulgare subsp. vulgare]|uniref:actinidain-like isoform X1 n=1 Tax=Hordeum vulgare subsp. vulgare TaxID=112509 RepID=UPI001D1A5978|nr:actinidain-like isoform X1 [Hordeum vulgare subsp. vulgare]
MRMRNPTAALSPAAMLLLLLLLVSPAAAATWTVSGREIWYRERSDVEARLVFGAWKAKFGKTYSSVGEEERRYAVFKETLRLVDQHNAAGEAGVRVARMGINGLADMTTEEWNVICCGAGRSGPPSTGGRKERSGRSRPWSSRGNADRTCTQYSYSMTLNHPATLKLSLFRDYKLRQLFLPYCIGVPVSGAGRVTRESGGPEKRQGGRGSRCGEQRRCHAAVRWLPWNQNKIWR